MRYGLAALVVLFAGLAARAADAPKANTLTPEEIADGWILLFDGETNYGWTTSGTVAVENGELKLGGAMESAVTTTASFGDFKLRFDYFDDGTAPLRLKFNGNGKRMISATPTSDWIQFEFTVQAKAKSTEITKTTTVKGKQYGGPRELMVRQNTLNVGFATATSEQLRVRNVKLNPLRLEPIFNGKDLTGW
jgi:hypothetical protein